MRYFRSMTTGRDPTPAELDYVEQVGQQLARSGLPPMAGRMWGWLIDLRPAGTDRRGHRDAPAGQPGVDQRYRPGARIRGAHPAHDQVG